MFQLAETRRNGGRPGNLAGDKYVALTFGIFKVGTFIPAPDAECILLREETEDPSCLSHRDTVII